MIHNITSYAIFINLLAGNGSCNLKDELYVATMAFRNRVALLTEKVARSSPGSVGYIN